MKALINAAAEIGAREALLEAAKEARTRGDIGKEGCIEVWDWLEYWADRKYPIQEPPC